MRYWIAENDTATLFYFEKTSSIKDYGLIGVDTAFSPSGVTVVSGYSGESAINFSGTTSNQVYRFSWGNSAAADYLSSVMTIDVIMRIPSMGTDGMTILDWANQISSFYPITFKVNASNRLELTVIPSGGTVTINSGSYDPTAYASNFQHARVVIDFVNKTLQIYACPIIGAANCTPQLVGSGSYTGTFTVSDFFNLDVGANKDQLAAQLELDTVRISVSDIPRTDTVFTVSPTVHCWPPDQDSLVLYTMNSERITDVIKDHSSVYPTGSTYNLTWNGANISDRVMAYAGNLGGARQIRHTGATPYWDRAAGPAIDSANYEGCSLEFLFKQEGTAPVTQLSPFLSANSSVGANRFEILINTDGTVQGVYGATITPKSAVIFPTTGIKHMRLNLAAISKLLTVEIADPGKQPVVVTSTTVPAWNIGAGGYLRMPGLDGNYQLVGAIRLSRVKRDGVYPRVLSTVSGAAYNGGFN